MSDGAAGGPHAGETSRCRPKNSEGVKMTDRSTPRRGDMIHGGALPAQHNKVGFDRSKLMTGADFLRGLDQGTHGAGAKHRREPGTPG